MTDGKRTFEVGGEPDRLERLENALRDLRIAMVEIASATPNTKDIAEQLANILKTCGGEVEFESIEGVGATAKIKVGRREGMAVHPDGTVKRELYGGVDMSSDNGAAAFSQPPLFGVMDPPPEPRVVLKPEWRDPYSPGKIKYGILKSLCQIHVENRDAFLPNPLHPNDSVWDAMSKDEQRAEMRALEALVLRILDRP